MFLDACGTDEEAYRISIVEFMKAGKVWPIVLLLRHIEGNYVLLLVMVVVLHLSLLFCTCLFFSPRFSSFLHVSLLFCVFLSTAISAIAPTVQYSSFSLNIFFLLHSTIPFHCNKQSDLGSSDYNFDFPFLLHILHQNIIVITINVIS